MDIPFTVPDISDAEINEVVDTLKSGWITTGAKTKLFEKRIAEYCNTSKVACLNSATSAMELTLRLLGIGPGDEVITTAYTYTATASVIDHVGAKIVLVDTAENGYQMDYDQLARSITNKTKVIMPVDIGGVMCDYDKIFEVVESKKSLYNPSNNLQKKYGRIVVLADAAHSFGATYKGKHSGEVADFTCFSFHAVKNLTTGEGGAVTWKDLPDVDNDEIYTQYMLFSLHGQSKDALAKTMGGAWEYDIVSPAYKCNMTDISASLGLGQLQRYPEILDKRKHVIEKYDKALSNSNASVLKHFGNNFSSSGHLYLVRLSGKDEEYRNKVIRLLAEKGIATNVHYKPLPLLRAYKDMGFDITDFPNAFNMYRNEITLPLHTLLTDEQIDYIIKNVVSIIEDYEVNLL